MFDWDDNILYMPTKVHVDIDGEPRDITTQGRRHNNSALGEGGIYVGSFELRVLFTNLGRGV